MQGRTLTSTCIRWARSRWSFRRELGGPSAEIDNRFWEPGDEWVDASSGLHFDIMYRSPSWIEDQLDRVLVRQEASLGYTTCFWHNIIHSKLIVDPRGWYATLQQRAGVPYPEGLRRAIVQKNLPILRHNRSSYRVQIARALERNDLVSRQHRIAALLASVFDIVFALERMPHPGEKRLLDHTPKGLAELVRGVIKADTDLMERVDVLLDAVKERIAAEGLTLPAARIEHAAAWVADRESPYIVLRSHLPGDMGMVVHLEGAGYVEQFGWDETFESLAARIVADFLANFDEARERCWIAEMDGRHVGHVFLVRHPDQPDTAKLRLLYVDPAARGMGLGQRLVAECVRFAVAAGYWKITLWTQSVLTAAHRIYRAAGFRLLHEEPHHSFGKDLIGQTWELELH